jgi:hypothetical protein
MKKWLYFPDEDRDPCAEHAENHPEMSGDETAA